MEAYRHSNSEVNQLKFVIRVMQVAALCISIFLAILSFVHLADLIYSASLVGVTAMMPTIFGTGLFLVSLLFEGWLALDINKIGEHAALMAIAVLLLLTAGLMIAPVTIASSLLGLNLLSLFIITIARLI
ncbi:Putative uncharacterized protein [Lactobacillus equicursoris DSM 19284 = JCM 14600 = CIP 110162]|uniref:Uncharacterized protein n=2 Tax=Lactobacillus equicursoris TaxID=420645 RepID=K0NF90_9LACO|nr:hypothetical protein [Lactobacillus equicursoris]KRL01445.1 hypothetical protein FC20_GL000906 [Lactobacillus equicursoris DSM 19284 = JCM 14600 = CIP 110162]CCK83630.1 Putative uncharacterized protein [Lactobacillus equicursoris 66c]CCK83842.1 Putative uncharacterized protein [Lactobacillus equicursoris 66c]CCK85869.1 Putative uncharacterized protein [Lactobacillus equicursoris DSM 19284 = JCM 14600 = CIP 110162]